MQSRGIGLLKGFGAASVLAALWVVSGCSKNEADSSDKSLSTSTAGLSAKSTRSPADKDGLTQAPLHYAARQPGGERSVVRQASLAEDVENLDSAEKRLKESISTNGGYIDHEEGENLASETPSMRLTIRVPEKSFETVLNGLESLGHRTQMTISASDLTEQILDVEAQIKGSAAKPVDGEYSEDAASVGKLNQLQALKNELLSKAAMSNIDLTLQQKPSGAGAVAANANWGSDTWNAALSSAMGAFRVVGAVALWIAAFSPIWGLVLLGSIWIYRGWRRTHHPAGA